MTRSGGIPNEAVYEARESEEAFEELLKSNSEHIKYTIYRTIHRIVTESDDEWSIAVSAFWEAVSSFDESKGDFLHFADVVITRRIIDNIRQNVRHGQEIPVDPDEALSNIPSEYTVEDMTRFEIEALSIVLREYGICFTDLVSSSPKSGKTRTACAAAVCSILDNDTVSETVRQSHALPMKIIEEISSVPRKTLERHRKYIIAAFEIMRGDYPELSEYMGPIKEYRRKQEAIL